MHALLELLDLLLGLVEVQFTLLELGSQGRNLAGALLEGIFTRLKCRPQRLHLGLELVALVLHLGCSVFGVGSRLLEAFDLVRDLVRPTFYSRLECCILGPLILELLFNRGSPHGRRNVLLEHAFSLLFRLRQIKLQSRLLVLEPGEIFLSLFLELTYGAI